MRNPKKKATNFFSDKYQKPSLENEIQAAILPLLSTSKVKNSDLMIAQMGS